MTRTKQWEWAETLWKVEWDAKLEVVDYVRGRSDGASIVANAARRLFAQWQLERDGQLLVRPVYDLFHPEFEELRAELDRIKRSPSEPAAEQDVIRLLEHLPPDAAAWVAIWTAVELARGEIGGPFGQDAARDPQAGVLIK
jgi:hypothetical protein